MASARRDKFLAALGGSSGGSMTERLCAMSVDAGVDGAAILVQSDSQISGCIAAAGPLGRALHDLEVQRGEGPAHQALREHRAILADQLVTGPSESWPIVSLDARERGIGALFALPLHVGSISIGVLEVCRAQPGSLSRAQFSDLAVIADLCTSALLLAQAGLQDGALMDLISAESGSQIPVHQAVGMVAQQENLSTTDALARMRAFALAEDMTVQQLARRIIAREIRMDG
jgi:transcriptional regulator with GAF, ATPase, and Fis domain